MLTIITIDLIVNSSGKRAGKGPALLLTKIINYTVVNTKTKTAGPLADNNLS